MSAPDGYATLTDEEMRFIERGQAIQAIASVRKRLTNGNLWAAKNIVDMHIRLMRPPEDPHYLLECDRRPTVAGEALLVSISRHDQRPMGFLEVHQVFAAHYPGRWALQAFPPQELLLNGANKYHLFVLEEPPAGMDLCSPAPRGTRAP